MLENQTYENVTKGQLNQTLFNIDQRIKSLETGGASRWEKFFLQKPLHVLGIVIVGITAAFWTGYTWQVKELKNNHESKVTRIDKEYKSRVKWLEQQNKLTLEQKSKQCEFDMQIIKNKKSACEKKLSKIETPGAENA